MKYLAKGKRSFVFLAKFKNKLAVIKKAKLNSQHRINHEADILKLLNKHHIGPRLFSASPAELCMEYIKGITIQQFLENKSNKSKTKDIISQILNQCRTLDKLKISKEEMCNPYKHIIITSKSKAVMIDFERAHYSEKPCNVTQFFQYLMKYKIVSLNPELKSALKSYKIKQTDENFKTLVLFL